MLLTSLQTIFHVLTWPLSFSTLKQGIPIILTPSLASRQATVIGYWLVPSVDQNRFSVAVSPTTTHSIFTMDIPRQFANSNTRVFLEVDQHLDQDASAITAGFHQAQDQILRAFADLANICPAGQVEPLPFPWSRTLHSFKFCSRERISFSVS
jgi:hypothetical protein